MIVTIALAVLSAVLFFGAIAYFFIGLCRIAKQADADTDRTRREWNEHRP